MLSMTDSNSTPVLSRFWENIDEIEVDPSWRRYLSPEYFTYREKFEQARRREFLGRFPLSIEIEATYHCNLKCPFCARVVKPDERNAGHMSDTLWKKFLRECERNGLKALMMDHEAESLMNPNFFKMLGEAKAAGIIDIWLHTNATLLTPERSALLIEGGLTKLNCSIDASTEETYNVLRVGGRFQKVVENVKTFLRIKTEKGAHHLRTRVSFVEQAENIREKRDFFEYWRRIPGVNMITFQECIDMRPFEVADEDSGLFEAALDRKYAEEEPFHCSAPWETPILDVNGNVIPCGQPVRAHNQDFILGNLNRGDTIASCWNGPKMTALRELHRKGEWYKNPMCRVCVKTLRESRRKLETLRRAVGPKEPSPTAH